MNGSKHACRVCESQFLLVWLNGYLKIQHMKRVPWLESILMSCCVQAPHTTGEIVWPQFLFGKQTIKDMLRFEVFTAVLIVIQVF